MERVGVAQGSLEMERVGGCVGASRLEASPRELVVVDHVTAPKTGCAKDMGNIWKPWETILFLASLGVRAWVPGTSQ